MCYPQALPREGVLSRLTTPSLLQWPAGAVAALFGDDVRRRFSEAASSVDLEFAGIVARPLYKCTEAGLPSIRREPIGIPDFRLRVDVLRFRPRADLEPFPIRSGHRRDTVGTSLGYR